MKIQSSSNLGNVTPEDFQKFTAIWIEEANRVINGKLDFTNFNSVERDVVFSSANVQVAVAHTLGRVPSRYLVTSLSGNMVIYKGSGTWTESMVYLSSSAAGTASVMIY